MDYMEQAGEEVVGVEEVRRLLTNCTYLEDSSVTLEGIRIHGSPWQPVFSNSAFNLPRGEELRQRWAWSPGTSRWAGVPEGTRLLVTHGPPLGVGDSCTYRGVPQGRAGGCRCRCSEQLPRVRGPAEEGGGGGEAGVPRVRARARGWVAWVAQGLRLRSGHRRHHHLRERGHLQPGLPAHQPPGDPLLLRLTSHNLWFG